MKKVLKYSFIVSFFCIAILTLNAQQALDFSIDLEKKEYVIGEPIYLEIVVTNNSNQSVELINPMELENQYLVVGVQHESQDKPDAFFPLSAFDTNAPPLKLGGRQSVGYFTPIHFGAAGWYFTNEGGYRIKAFYDYDKEKEVVSNTIDIEVRSNGQFDNIFQFESDGNLELGKYTIWQSGDHLKKGLETADKLRNESAALSNYYLYYEGIRFSKSFKDYTRQQVRPFNAQRSHKMFLEADIGQLPVYLQMQALIAETKNAIRFEDKGDAIDFLQQAKNLQSDFVSLQNFNQQIEKLNKIVLGMN